MKKNVVVLGKGSLAIKIARWFYSSPLYTLTSLVPQIPEPSWTDSLMTWGEEHNIPVIQSGDYRELLKSKQDRIDLGVSVFYDKIIGKDLISSSKKLINIHNSPLPKYRGVKPIHWALKNKERIHGVTIHEITEGIDDGPILSQVTYSIFPEVEEVIDVYERSLDYAWLLFQQTIPFLWDITPREQDGSQATYYSRREDHLLEERLSISRNLQNRKPKSK